MADSETRSTTRAPAVSARERAKRVMARKRAAEIEREKAIEEALATVLSAGDAEQRAVERRRDALAAARAAYDETMVEVNRRSGQALRRMRELDEPVSSIAALTGLPRARITELLRLANQDAVHAADGSPVADAQPTTSSDSDGRGEQVAVEALDQAPVHAEPVGVSG